ncbi:MULTISPECIES: thioesterase II family protein [Nostoc]|uniref:Thioesterase n=1 Tax=Nostoc paludosum FACHB-159 TaxID=2692908 RepID=A0ABR8KF13_9NOSO|nr:MULTISPECIES: thioesterase II family protein [Nostoc]MBD2681692.1 thioesterase [Nostoc sp. FACHB-857]MBD2738152.1 thioesterase [Nostoc paludosum FACHB-159]
MTTTPTLNSLINCPQPNPQANLRLFCFPYAGGSSMIFRTWSNSLPRNVEVCAVEYPGRGRQIKSAPIAKLQPLVKAIASSALPYLDKPFAFFGHSMGGLVSFELTRLLRLEYNLKPFHLFISARRAPQIPPTKPPIHGLPEAELLEELRTLNGTPKAVLENPELMQIFLPFLRADFAVLETYNYTPQQPLDCPITIFGGWQDKEVSHEALQAWREQTTATCSLQMFDGDHFFIHPYQNSLLKLISQELGVRN